MANDVKNWIYIWCSKRKDTPPVYTFTEHRPMKANGARSNQPNIFEVELRIGTVTFVAKGSAKGKKEAQTLAAKDMVKHLVDTGVIERQLTKEIPGCAHLAEEESKEKAAPVPYKKIDAMKASYGRWQGGELTRDGKVVLEADEANDLRKRKRDQPEGEDVAFYGHKKTKLDDGVDGNAVVTSYVPQKKSEEPAEILEKTLAKIVHPKQPAHDNGTIHLDDEDDSQQPSTSRQISRTSLGTSGYCSGQSESPEIIEVKGTSPTDNHDDDVIIEENSIALSGGQDDICRQLRKKFPEEFKRFDDNIWLHWRRNGQDEKTFQWKMRVRTSLLELLQQHIGTDCRLFAVGSTINGCGSYNSDMDLCLTVPDPYVGYDTERDYAFDVLKQVQWYLRRCSQIVKQVQLIPAKVPILKLAMQPPFDELEIDLNCNNVAGIYNSHLLHYYAKVDDRFAAICLIVKHWAIKADINDAMTGTFNSYSLILLVLHYLQCVPKPAVLPNLQQLFPAHFTGQQDVYSLELFKDFPEPIPGCKENKQSVGELLIGFFDYYSRFNFKSIGISVRRGECFDRSQLAADTRHFQIYIEEPFDGKNTARCVTKVEKLHRIKNELNRAITQLRSRGPVLDHIKVTV